MAHDCMYPCAYSAPLSLIPQLVGSGLFFSGLDLVRRIGIEEMLKREEANEFSKQMRKDDRNYNI